jgi:2-desacetyl-2-hydroxyethyl bacteriochlorophyllide A dehydrogenase
MSQMKAVQIAEPGADFEVVEIDVPEPGPREVRIKVQACGICHSDAFVKEGAFPGIDYPRVPGHEVIGTVDKVGDEVELWTEGERVGVGWHGGHCFDCEACRDGDFIQCENAKITGIAFDGGYAEYMVAPGEAIAAVPDALESEEAAPLLCAGITVYNSLRNSGARAGDVVAVQGIGGLGHLAVQYAKRMGFHTVALSRGTDKKELALELGADDFIDTEAEDAAERLSEMGGARVIVATAPSSQAMTSVIGGLGRNGELLIVAASNEPVEVSPMQLIMGRRSISGWPSGHAADSEDTLDFSALTDITAMIETFPLDRAGEAYQKMMDAEVRFRAVLVMD